MTSPFIVFTKLYKKKEKRKEEENIKKEKL